MVHGYPFNFLSINLVKLHNTPYIGGLTTLILLFSRETETTKVSNLFDLHHIAGCNYASKRYCHIFNYSQNLCVNNPY